MPRKGLATFTVLVLALGFSMSTATGQTVVYVDVDAPPGGDGSSWETAFNDLQDALGEAAGSGGTVTEIRVAEGVYRPAGPGGDRTATFQLVNGVALKGGYAGFGEPEPDERDIIAHETTLSGDLNGDDIPPFSNNSENSYHVVTGSGVGETAVLDGLTIRGGNADGPVSYRYDRGGGMHNAPGSPTLTNCTFSGNSAECRGGAINCDLGSSPTILSCAFHENSAESRGAAVNCDHASSPTFVNCTFSTNTGGWAVIFLDHESSPTLTNCTVSAGAGFFAGILMYDESSPTITNCTVSADIGARAGIVVDLESTPTIVNSILWGHARFGIAVNSGFPVVTSCDVKAGWPGEYNIDADPHFVDPDGPDGVPGTEDDDLRIPTRSPCVDAGDNAAVPLDTSDLDGDGDTTEPIPFDLDSNPRFLDDVCSQDTGQHDPNHPELGIVDMGAYEHAENLAEDTDADGWPNCYDNCPWHPNPGQADCDEDAIGDACALALKLSYDCTGNGIPDECDIADGTSEDANGDGVPDECQSILFVDVDVPLGGDGTSWATAFCDLQDALAVAERGNEIRVAGGSYTPAGSGGDRFATFQLIDGAVMYGAFAGYGQPNPDERNIDLYETILSGDLNGDDGPNFANNEENSYHVVTVSNTDATTVVDGFTITGGNADGPYEEHLDRGGGVYNYDGNPTLMHCTISENSVAYGGGMYITSGDPALTNCAFRNNSATRSGAGMYNDDLSSPTFTNCSFTDNFAGISGGGVFNDNWSSPTLTNCTFRGNSAVAGAGMRNDGGTQTLRNCAFMENSASSGAGIYNGLNRPTLLNCVFSGNVANYGAAVRNWHSKPTLINCLFNGNSASEDGGAMYVTDSTLILANCTFAANAALNGRALACGSATWEDSSSVEIANSVLWDGEDEIWNDDDSTIAITYSDVEGGCAGEGNIDADPLFVGGPRGCYYLSQTAAGQPEQSPCVDAGSDTAENLGLDTLTTRTDEVPDDGIVDMGYHYGENDGSIPDCNDNGVADECDIAGETSDDCQPNGIPDECDIVQGTSEDLNENGVPDECEEPVKRPMAEDCATIDPGTRCDVDGGAIPCVNDDDCAWESHCVLAPVDQPGLGNVCYAPKTRYLSIARNPEQVDNTARRVKLDEGTLLGWVDTPEEDASTGLWRADIVPPPAEPVYVEQWPDVVHVKGCEIAHANLCDGGTHCMPNGCPGTETCVHHSYHVQAIALGQDIGDENNYSEVLELHTNTTWGDTCTSGPGGLIVPPDGVTGLADIMAAIAYFQGNTTIAPLTWLDIAPSTEDDSPDQVVGLGDIMGAIGGFQGDPYPGLGPLGCGSSGPRIGGYSNSGCLRDGDEACADPDEVEFTVVGPGTLHVLHTNATYNCCPADIVISVSLEGNMLNLIEEEIEGEPCDCICCYNVEATVVDLAPGAYTVRFCWFDYETGGEQCYIEDIVIP